MKLHLSNPDGLNTITGYGADWVSVNGTRHQRSLIVLPDRLVGDWSVASPDSLSVADVEYLVGLAPELILLGTGPRLRFPAAGVLRPAAQARMGLEVMDTSAACRTFNILAAEGRRVAAALILA